MSLAQNDFRPTEESVRAALAPPAAVKAFMNPVEDDTWVRQTQLVKLEALRAGNDDVAAKRALLAEHTSCPNHTLRRTADGVVQSEEASIIAGMEWQGKFIKEYKQQSASEDRNRALDYKEQMVQKFRNKQSTTDS